MCTRSDGGAHGYTFPFKFGLYSTVQCTSYLKQVGAKLMTIVNGSKICENVNNDNRQIKGALKYRHRVFSFKPYQLNYLDDNSFTEFFHGRA